MRATLWIIILLVAAILTVGLVSNHVTSKVTQEYSQQAIQIKESIKKDDWDGARRITEEMEKKWKSTCEWLQFWVDHQDTDNVNLALKKILAAIEVKNLDSYYQADADLMESLQHVQHRSALTIGNLL
jgi:predicted Holliday junction resolvase-like endonuclease